MSELGKRIGQRIKDLRTLRPERHTQEGLAERAHISVSFLSMIERGERVAHMETCENVAQALGVTLCELFNGVESWPLENPSDWQQLIDFIREKRLRPDAIRQLLDQAKQMFPDKSEPPA